MELLRGSVILLSAFYLCQIVALVDLALPTARLLISKKTRDSLNLEVLSDIPNSNVVVDRGSKVVLACNASYPVQWKYHGNGVPLFSTNTSEYVNTTHHRYEAFTVIEEAKESHTGKYICSYAEFPSIASYYYIYVPGPKIFTSDRRQHIIFTKKEDTVTIPCGVTHPEAEVILQKSHNNGTLETIDSFKARYDPKTGFSLTVRSLDYPEGTYLCTATLGNEFRVLDFKLEATHKIPEPKPKPPKIADRFQNPCSVYRCPDGSECLLNPTTGNPFCKCNRDNHFPDASIKCIRYCEENEDCFSAEKCVMDSELGLSTCKDVCVNMNCSENTYCVHNIREAHTPKCQCKKGYQKPKKGGPLDPCEAIPLHPGNDTSYCTPTNCGPNSRCTLKNGKAVCACQIDAAGMPPNCKKVCSVNSDCPIFRKCSSQGVCTDVCNEFSCGENALCRSIRRKPSCICPPGYKGDASVKCYRDNFYALNLE